MIWLILLNKPKGKWYLFWSGNFSLASPNIKSSNLSHGNIAKEFFAWNVVAFERFSIRLKNPSRTQIWIKWKPSEAKKNHEPISSKCARMYAKIDDCHRSRMRPKEIDLIFEVWKNTAVHFMFIYAIAIS